MTLTIKEIETAVKQLSPAKGGTYTIESFESIFKLKIGNSANENLVFMGLDGSGMICIFVKGKKSEFDDLPLSQEFLHDNWNEASGRFEALMISKLPKHLEDLIYVLIVNISKKLEHTVTKIIGKDITEVIIDSLATELSTTALMSNSLRIGLFGELVLLNYLLDASKSSDYLSVLNLWTGSGKAKRDFLTKNGFVEVKTTGKPNRIHQINDIEQLRLKGTESKGYLFSVKAKSDDSGTKHLVEMINEIRNKLVPMSLETMFDDKLENYGGEGEGYFRALEPAYNRMKKYLYDPKDDAFYELTDEYRIPKRPPLPLPTYVELDGYNLNLTSAPHALTSTVLKWILS